MSESYNLLDNLKALFSPREAEAKVIPKDKAAEELHQYMTQFNPPFQGLLPNLWKSIFDKAESLPSEVSLYAGTPFNEKEFSDKTRGYYNPNTQEIFLKPEKENLDSYPPGDALGKFSPSRRELLSHELLHFLLSDYIKKDGEKLAVEDKLNLLKQSHPIIQYILGTDEARDMLGYYGSDLFPVKSQPPRFLPFPYKNTEPSKVISDFIQNILPAWYPETRKEKGK